MSIFENCALAPIDPILGTTVAFRADPDSRKVNLGVGAYRDEEGKPLIFKVVKKVEQEIITMDKEYAPIEGMTAILKEPCVKLLFGDKIANKDNIDRIASAQSISGTGALRLGADFLSKHINPPAVYMSEPTWETHKAIFRTAGIEVREYPWWKAETKSLNIDGMCSVLESAPSGSVVLLHACAHNPTGLDPTSEQWGRIVDIMQSRKLVPFVDNAYQGYASGDLDKDGFLQRLLISKSFEFVIAQSFAKNLGMYGERIGMIHFITKNADTATRVLSQLKLIIRPMYSSPPIHGARLVAGVLGNAENLENWKLELKEVAARINRVRHELREGLEKKTGTDWSHITNQIGMFSFTGLTESQCELLISKWHIYLLKNGRISLAGLNKNNIQYVIDAFHDVVTQP